MYEVNLTVPVIINGRQKMIKRITIRNLQKDGSLKYVGWVAYRDVANKNWLYSYGGWSLERKILQVLAKSKVMQIHFFNVDTGELLTSTLKDWRDYGLVLPGINEEVLLPDKYWKHDTKDYSTEKYIQNTHNAELILSNFAKKNPKEN